MKRTTDWAKPAWAEWLDTAAAITTLIGVLWLGGGYVWSLVGGSVDSILALLMRQVTVPLGLLLAVPVAVMMVTAYGMRRLYLRSLDRAPEVGKRVGPTEGAGDSDEAPISAASEPHLVSQAELSSLITVPTRIVDAVEGSVSLWLFVDDPKHGIRNLKNNRYLFAQAGNKGRKAKVGAERAYLNVFALSCSPVAESQDARIWRVFISSAAGRKIMLRVPDTLSSPRWHHFLVRWDHVQPRLELVIDGERVASTEDYQACWPESEGVLTFGTWPTRNPIHYIESKLWRIRIVENWIGDGALADELKQGAAVQ